MMRVAAHAHRHEFDQDGSAPCPRLVSGEFEGAGNGQNIVAVDIERGYPVADRFVSEAAHATLLRDWGRECCLIILNTKDHGKAHDRRTVDSLVPFAERRSAFADEA